MEEAIDAGFEAILVTADAPPGGNRERDRRNRFTLPKELGTPSLTAATGGERALTIEQTFALMNHALDLGRRRRPRLRMQRPGPRQGPRSPPRTRSWRSSTAPPASSSPTTAAASSTAALATADALPEVAEALDGPRHAAGRRRHPPRRRRRHRARARRRRRPGRPARPLGPRGGRRGGRRAGSSELLRAELELTLGALRLCTRPPSSPAPTCGERRPRPYIRSE